MQLSSGHKLLETLSRLSKKQGTEHVADLSGEFDTFTSDRRCSSCHVPISSSHWFRQMAFSRTSFPWSDSGPCCSITMPGPSCFLIRLAPLLPPMFDPKRCHAAIYNPRRSLCSRGWMASDARSKTVRDKTIMTRRIVKFSPGGRYCPTRMLPPSNIR